MTGKKFEAVAEGFFVSFVSMIAFSIFLFEKVHWRGWQEWPMMDGFVQIRGKCLSGGRRFGGTETGSERERGNM